METQTEFRIEDGVLLRYKGYEKQIVIPDGVTAIGDWAFYDGYVQSVKIPDSVVVIGENAFALCKYLETVEIPDSVLRIAAFAFYRCSNLKTVVMGDNVRSIGGCAFKECSLLQTVRISKKILKIGQEAFAECPQIQDFHFGGKFKVLGQCFENYFNKTLPAEIVHLVLRNPADFHPDDIVYAWKNICDRYDFQNLISKISYPELRTMEKYGLITKENKDKILDLLCRFGDAECISELIRYLSQNQTSENYMEKFHLEL